jgi:hypothetical protein
MYAHMNKRIKKKAQDPIKNKIIIIIKNLLFLYQFEKFLHPCISITVLWKRSNLKRKSS